MGSRTSYCRTITTGVYRPLVVYRISSGGVTRYMLPALQRFAARHVPPGTWEAKSVHLLADEPRVHYRQRDDGTRERYSVTMPIVRVTFKLRHGRAMLAVDLDGYCWGYNGEGPRGLADTVEWISRVYGAGNLSRYIALQLVTEHPMESTGRLFAWSWTQGE